MKELFAVLCLLMVVGNIISWPVEEILSEEGEDEYQTFGKNGKLYGSIYVLPAGK